jgi:uncharacterized protein YigA (DUF484 family)
MVLSETAEKEVVDYLGTNPDFFQRHPELLKDLELPHQSGDALSLIERQVQMLREEATTHKQKLEELIRVAHENEQLAQRLHRLTLTIIDTIDFDELVNVLQDTLHEDFQAEAVELHIYTHHEDESKPDLDGFRELLDKGAPQCGRLSPDKLEYLFGPQAEDVKSTAMIPFREESILGILAIGSSDEHRFHAGMGTEYLSRLGEVISKSLEVRSEPGF